MKEKLATDLRNAMSGSGKVLYHIALVSLSAGIALSLPFVAQGFLTQWARIQNEGAFLLSAEITVAIVLIVFFNHLSRSIKYRKLAKAASGAGLVYFFPAGGRMAQRRIKTLIHRHGLARNVMIIGSTGSTFVDPQGDSHAVVKDCLGAKIMLLNPCSEDARIRARSILHPDITLESLKEQARKSVEFLKLLKAAQKNVKLKFYSDDPNVKLAILGDHIWLQHYHTSLDVQTMPVYVFKHNPKDHGLYTVFYQHFVKRWESPEIPEYDLETDELVYRGGHGIEERREKFHWDVGTHPSGARLPAHDAPRAGGDGQHPSQRVSERDLRGAECAPQSS
ncbi:MAG: hypothetical protein O7C73_06270 [Nitrospirae bacterium]|nr:hypothetical protein [Nitrospirota bacterium]